MPAAPVAAKSCLPDTNRDGAASAVPISIRRMTKRSQFLAANGGVRVPMPGFVLLVHPRQDGDATAGFGITATKKLGGAVIRNRAKRRLRALVRDQFSDAATAGADHVLIARADAVTLDYRQLATDLSKALAKVPRRLAQRHDSA